MPDCKKCGKPIVFHGQDENGKWIPPTNPDGSKHEDPRPAGGGFRGGGGRSAAELHDIRHEAVLNSAVAYYDVMAKGGGLGSLSPQQVVETAEVFLRFVEKGRPADFAPSAAPQAQSAVQPPAQPRPPAPREPTPIRTQQPSGPVRIACQEPVEGGKCGALLEPVPSRNWSALDLANEGGRLFRGARCWTHFQAAEQRTKAG